MKGPLLTIRSCSQASLCTVEMVEIGYVSSKTAKQGLRAQHRCGGMQEGLPLTKSMEFLNVNMKTVET